MDITDAFSQADEVIASMTDDGVEELNEWINILFSSYIEKNPGLWPHDGSDRLRGMVADLCRSFGFQAFVAGRLLQSEEESPSLTRIDLTPRQLAQFAVWTLDRIDQLEGEQ